MENILARTTTVPDQLQIITTIDVQIATRAMMYHIFERKLFNDFNILFPIFIIFLSLLDFL
jgi:hypothetical protein